MLRFATASAPRHLLVMLFSLVCREVPTAVTMLPQRVPTPSHMDKMFEGVRPSIGIMLAVQEPADAETVQQGAEYGAVSAASQQLGYLRPQVAQLSGHRAATEDAGAAALIALAGTLHDAPAASCAQVKPFMSAA